MRFFAESVDQVKSKLDSAIVPMIVIALVVVALGVILYVFLRDQNSRNCAFCGARLRKLPGGWATTCHQCGKDQPAPDAEGPPSRKGPGVGDSTG